MKNNPKSTKDIFLSYSNLDKDIALELQERLETNGLKCFMAGKNIEGGDKWVDTIRYAIKDAKKILLLITPRSCDSAWIHMEIGAAWMEGKKIIPILQFVDPKQLPDIVKNHQATIIETEAQRLEFIHSLIMPKGDDASQHQMTTELVLEKISIAKSKMNQDTFVPNLIVGSGKGGALCAAIFASQFSDLPLKVVDCHFRGTGLKRETHIDDSSLNDKDIRGKNVLVVEWARKSGRTYKIIKDRIDKMKPAEVRSYALFWTKENKTAPHYYGGICKYVPQNPWGTY